MTEEQPARGVHRVCRFLCRPLENTLCVGAQCHTQLTFLGPRPSVLTMRLSGPRAPLFGGAGPGACCRPRASCKCCLPAGPDCGQALSPKSRTWKQPSGRTWLRFSQDPV